VSTDHTFGTGNRKDSCLLEGPQYIEYLLTIENEYSVLSFSGYTHEGQTDRQVCYTSFVLACKPSQSEQGPTDDPRAFNLTPCPGSRAFNIESTTMLLPNILPLDGHLNHKVGPVEGNSVR
jgi:hypothetical protein